MNEKQSRQAPQPGAIDELALQNGLRKRYATNWPAVILELTKRVTAVNQQWAKIMLQIMHIDNLRITYAKVGDNLEIDVSCNGEVELHKVPLEEMQKAMPYIEVLVMDKLCNSKLIEKYATAGCHDEEAK